VKARCERGQASVELLGAVPALGAALAGSAPEPCRSRATRRFAPVRPTAFASIRATSRWHRGGRDSRDVPVDASATAELSPPAGAGAAFPASASGGGYTGTLAYRQGKPMRPDVALAFDRMDRAARDDGIALIVSSGFRSDAEQAALFAAHPDPKWVAPPGQSLHRLGTELDLGPAAAYGWLAANAPRFGFVLRYSWSPGIGATRATPAARASGTAAAGERARRPCRCNRSCRRSTPR
jgi:hypothetical protein